eukprot:1160878-Pelagomonas_calceolata.AAC.13
MVLLCLHLLSTETIPSLPQNTQKTRVTLLSKGLREPQAELAKTTGCLSQAKVTVCLIGSAACSVLQVKHRLQEPRAEHGLQNGPLPSTGHRSLGLSMVCRMDFTEHRVQEPRAEHGLQNGPLPSTGYSKRH